MAAFNRKVPCSLTRPYVFTGTENAAGKFAAKKTFEDFDLYSYVEQSITARAPYETGATDTEWDILISGGPWNQVSTNIDPATRPDPWQPGDVPYHGE